MHLNITSEIWKPLFPAGDELIHWAFNLYVCANVWVNLNHYLKSIDQGIGLVGDKPMAPISSLW